MSYKVSTMNSSKDLAFYIGTNEWGRQEWKGNLYPNQVANKDLLTYYSNVFNFVELKATFYNADIPLLISRISAVTNKEFKFSPWISKDSLKHIDSELQADNIKKFLDQFDIVKDRMGPAVITIQQPYSAGNRDKLYKLIGNLSAVTSAVINVYENSWHQASHFENLLDHANKNKAVVVLRAIKHMKQVVSPVTYFHYDLSRDFDIDDFIKSIDKATKEIYICVTGTDKLLVIEKLKVLKSMLV